MNSLCIYVFFYLFLSGSILFTILGVFAGFGNPVLIIENTQKDKNNSPIEEEGIKKRVTMQYFIASFLDLSFCKILNKMGLYLGTFFLENFKSFGELLILLFSFFSILELFLCFF